MPASSCRRLLVATTLGALLAGAAAWSAARAACDDPSPRCGFVLPESLAVPPAFGGVPVWSAHDCYGDAPGAPLADRFVVDRRVEGRWTRVPVRVRLPLGDEAVADWPAAERGNLVLVAPEGGFAPGGEYRVTRKDVADAPSTTQWLRVAAATPAADSASLLVGGRLEGPLVFPDVPGAGYPRYRAVARRLTLVLPPAWRPFASSLLVTTRVDGESWRPVLDACRRGVPPGTSVLGPLADVVFAPCGTLPQPPPDPRRAPEREPHALAPGTHLVEMRAWLPGTPLTLTARTVVTLDCP